MSRFKRKNEHLHIAVRGKPVRANFSDIRLIHNCLPDLDLNQVSLKAQYLGRTHRSPLFINALTGGTGFAAKINANLAYIAKTLSMPMAVGSQLIALKHPECQYSFRIVRKVNPQGEIWANIGSYATVQMALEAVEMIKADALQIHLNVAQELTMEEGDSHFKGVLERIANIVDRVTVPVIVKEVGFGMAYEEAGKLFQTGVSAVDTGGGGGTNFIGIESLRRKNNFDLIPKMWGIPSAISLIESVTSAGSENEVFASGGIFEALDIAKALSLGATAVGMAGMPLYYLLRKGRESLVYKIKLVEAELKAIMLLVGAGTIDQLRERPLVITGFTAEWLERRGIDPKKYACRSI